MIACSDDMWTEHVLELLRPRPRDDLETHELVRAKLALVSEHPERIAATVEHGCVTLAGAIVTPERGRLVRAIARVRGVDAVVDLLREQNDVPPPAPRPRRRVQAVRAGWPAPARLAAIGAGAGLAIAGLRLRGIAGTALALAGALFAARGATDVRLRLADA